MRRLSENWGVEIEERSNDPGDVCFVKDNQLGKAVEKISKIEFIFFRDNSIHLTFSAFLNAEIPDCPGWIETYSQYGRFDYTFKFKNERAGYLNDVFDFLKSYDPTVGEIEDTAFSIAAKRNFESVMTVIDNKIAAIEEEKKTRALTQQILALNQGQESLRNEVRQLRETVLLLTRMLEGKLSASAAAAVSSASTVANPFRMFVQEDPFITGAHIPGNKTDTFRPE